MLARVHILLILLTIGIIGVVALFWRQANESFSTEGEPVLDPNRVITIARADWGLNCQGKPIRKKNNEPVAAGIAPVANVYEVKENNVQAKLAALCNGQHICNFKANDETLGEDPAPGCDKLILVEYRCFSYDSAWSIEGKANSALTIDCTQ